MLNRKKEKKKLLNLNFLIFISVSFLGNILLLLINNSYYFLLSINKKKKLEL